MLDSLLLFAQTSSGKLQHNPMVLIFGDWGRWNFLHFFAFFFLFILLYTPWFRGMSIMGMIGWFLLPFRLNKWFDRLDGE